jgi:hypothetical protein
MRNPLFGRVAVVVAFSAGAWMVAPAGAQATTLGAAGRATPSKVVNIIKDAGAEGAKGNSEGTKVAVKDWTVSKSNMFTAVPYGAPEFPTKHSPGPKNRGKNFFAGGPSGTTSTGRQVDTLKPYKKLISSGKAAFTLSGWLGGFSSQDDDATLTATWETTAGAAISHTTIGPVTEAQRKGITGMLHRSSAGVVPKGATQVLITLHMVRYDGEYVDGYADNLRLTIQKH